MKLNRRISSSIMVVIVISIVLAENALSWSGATHRILSNHGALNSVLKKGNYLVNYLGFQDGLGEIFFNGKIKSKALSNGCKMGLILRTQGT
jgi:hypothetical protein